LTSSPPIEYKHRDQGRGDTGSPEGRGYRRGVVLYYYSGGGI